MKPRLTLEEHKELGQALAGMEDELRHRSIQLDHAYPRGGREEAPARYVQQALEGLRAARTALDHMHFAEHGDAGCVHTYYPADRDRAVVRGPRVRAGVDDCCR